MSKIAVEHLMVMTPEGLREATDADVEEWRRQQERDARNAAEISRIQAALDARAIYPCNACGKLCSKAEGGVMTICDDCWESCQ